MLIGSGSSSRPTRFAVTHARYGRRAARSRLISSSSITRPRTVSTMNMRPGLMRPFERDRLGRPVERARLGCEDDEIVIGHDVACGTEAIPIERAADHATVG